MPEVASTAIARVAYSEKAQTLRITFEKRGEVYTYSGVPSSEFRGLMEAGSKGTYFNNHIRNGYPYRRGR
jgi:hypothetical protein